MLLGMELGRPSMRARILASVGALVLLSLLGSTLSLYRITDVKNTLDSINRAAIPFGRILTQLQSDSDILSRETERRLGYSQWKDPHWRPQPLPRWIVEVVGHEVQVARQLVGRQERWIPGDRRERWASWGDEISTGLERIQVDGRALYEALLAGDQEQALKLYPDWAQHVDSWHRKVDWGVREYDRALSRSFSAAEDSVGGLRTGLKVILGVVVFLSLLLLWLGERGLRPLADLTALARDISHRGLRKEDKARLPSIPLSREDEVSGLAREFHRMATTLLEREKTVESQTRRLEVQYRLLREMGSLNENILNSIESVLLVADSTGKITQCNPGAALFLARPSAEVMGSLLNEHPALEPLHSLLDPARSESVRIPLTDLTAGGVTRSFGGQVLPLKAEDGSHSGIIAVLEDQTDQQDLERRLRLAENLAAVGRMSAQVAHEVRNPLHSIGLEAEFAIEALQGVESSGGARQALQSILQGVERLEKITANYLNLTKLSPGRRTVVDLRSVLESVLATYYPACEAQGVEVDWSLERGAVFSVHGDRDLLEQALGNLFRNALQALEGRSTAESPSRVLWRLGNTEAGQVWVRITDNGAGVDPSVREKLFTPFVTTKAQGTGLGLSFSRKVMLDHGGELRCVPHEGGACFELSLPMTETLADAGRIHEVIS